MTDKEKKAIEHIDKRLTIEKYTKNIETAVNIRELQIVLNLIKTQEAEIEKYKQLYDKALSDVVRLDRESHLIQSRLDESDARVIELNDIINEMSEHIVSSAVVDDTVCAVKFCEIEEDCTHERMLKCTKQYFERKSGG